MTATDAPAFLAHLSLLAELFDAKFSEAKQQLYFEALSDIELGSLQDAMREAARSCKFMPKPIELRELAVGSVADWAETAWLEFRADIRRIGQYGTWNPDDDSTRRAVREVFGSWSDACASELSPEMWQARKKEFIRVYSSWERARVEQQALPPGTAVPKLLT